MRAATWLRRSDRLLRLALSQSRQLYPLGGADPVRAKWLARARQRPRTLTLYTPTYQFAAPIAQVFVSNL